MAATSPGIFSRSNVIAAAFVLAAGVFAWRGMSGQSAEPPPVTSEPLTMAATVTSGAAGTTAAVAIDGGLPTRLVAPAAGIDTSIVEVGLVKENGKTTWETAWHAAGHHLTSARPGQPGNMVITGHVSVADASVNSPVFANLSRLKAGDVVEVYSGTDVYKYTIQSTSTVLPTALHVLRSSHQSRLTLITCTPDLKSRLVVVGTLSEAL